MEYPFIKFDNLLQFSKFTTSLQFTFTGVWSVLVISAARAAGRRKFSPGRYLRLRVLAMVAAAARYVVLVARETAGAALPARHHGRLD